MAAASPKRATLDDLARVPGKAELIGGRIVRFMPVGRRPNLVAGRIFRSLDDHARAVGGEACTDNIGFTVRKLASGRESFSPDVSYHPGPFSGDEMAFIQGPPALAVEVRSKNDYGPIAEKRADYFATGTLVVWDVDPVANSIRVHRVADPDNPTVYTSGKSAQAEPALPDGGLTSMTSSPDGTPPMDLRARLELPFPEPARS